MSLWSTPVSQITFADVDQFCREMHPEGVLDYQGVALPKDSAKTIAAFANTLGGLILLGVEALGTKRPILPSGRPRLGCRWKTAYQNGLSKSPTTGLLRRFESASATSSPMNAYRTTRSLSFV